MSAELAADLRRRAHTYRDDARALAAMDGGNLVDLDPEYAAMAYREVARVLDDIAHGWDGKGRS